MTEVSSMRLPDPSSSASPSTLRWFRNSVSAQAPSRCVPVVVILTWIQARPDIVRKYVDLYLHQGCDVAVFHTPALAMWVPSWASSSASAILTELNKELADRGPRPLVFSVFSGATKAVYYKILQQLAPAQHGPLQPPSDQASHAGPGSSSASPSSPARSTRWMPWPASRASPPAAPLPRFPEVQRCFCAQIFDSSPVDFTSHAGVELLNPSPSPSPSLAPRSGPAPAPLSASASATAAARRAAATLAAGALDFMLVDWFEKQRQEMWNSLKHLAADTRHPNATSASEPPLSPSPPAVPTLFLYSWNDPLADPLRIHQLAAALRARGGLVLEQAWQESEHVGHLKAHGGQYGTLVEELLGRVRQGWEQERRAAAGEQQCREPLPPAQQEQEVEQQQQRQQEHSSVCSESEGQGHERQHEGQKGHDGPVERQEPYGWGSEVQPFGRQGQQDIAADVARLAELNAGYISQHTQALYQLHNGLSLSPVKGGRRQLRSKL